MKIKIVVLEKDIKYINRLANVFNVKYPEQFEIHSFSNMDSAMSYIQKTKVDVFLAHESYDLDSKMLSNMGCVFSYLTESTNIDSVKGMASISKYQKVDLIYKQILSIYSENAANMSIKYQGDYKCKIVVFSSPVGGTGNSTMAVAFSVYLAQKSKNVLYLNLEDYGSSDTYFSGEGQYDMSDIIYALKSKNVNLSLKLESNVKQDSNGVFFFSQSKTALDIKEIKENDIDKLLEELKGLGKYDYVIIDKNYGLDACSQKIYDSASAVVWISDGQQISNNKIERAYETISIIGENNKLNMLHKLFLGYNKFSNKNGKIIENMDVIFLGGCPKYEGATIKQEIEQISNNEMFEKLL